MKKVFLIRHAKSSWENPTLDDFSRPLNERGQRNAPRMAKRLKEKRLVLDLIISSPALRAIDTAKIMADILNYPKNNIQTIPTLYHASPEKIIDILKNIKDKYNTVMLVGHNPGLTELADEMVELDINNIPTCGIVALAFTIQSWKELGSEKAELLFYDYPKKKPQED